MNRKINNATKRRQTSKVKDCRLKQFFKVQKKLHLYLLANCVSIILLRCMTDLKKKYNVLRCQRNYT